MTPPVRIPLVFDINPMTKGGLQAFTYRENVMDEQYGETTYVMKRPGVDMTQAFSAGTGQGILRYASQNWAVIGDNLVTSTSYSNGADGTAWTATVLGPPYTRQWAASAYFNGRWYVNGGYNGTLTNLGDTWSTADGVTWRNDAVSTPFGTRFLHRFVVFQNKLWCIGGVQSDTTFGQFWTHYNDVWSSPDGVTWTLETGSAAFLPRCGHALMVFGNNLYVCGGRGLLINFDDVWSSPNGKTWTRVATAPWGQRWDMGYAVFNNKMFVAGGQVAGVTQNNVYSSSDGGANWGLESAAAFASAREAFTILVYNNKMWMIGGYNPATITYFNDVYSTTTGTGAWTAVGTVPQNIQGYVAAVIPSPYSTAPVKSFSIAYTQGKSDFAYPTQGRIATLNTTIGTSTALSPTTNNLQYQLTSYQQGRSMLIKNPTNLWVMNAGGVVKVNDQGYPASTVPGIVNLGGFVYVMDPTGLIYNCALDDPTTWPSLNVLGADFDDDAGVCLARYLNYLVAFGTYSTQLFYDAGLSPGSPLQPYLNANMKIGCADAATVAAIENTLVWVSNTREGERKVMVMNGITPTPISTTFVEKFLGNLNNIQGVLVSLSGHQFYVLNVTNGDIPAPSLVFDFSTKRWVNWTLYINNTISSFRFVANDGNLLLHPTDGKIYSLNPDSSIDVGSSSIPVTIISSPIDGGTLREKFWGRLDLVADQQEQSGTIAVSFSDDFGSTFSVARNMDLNSARPSLFRNGQSRRRMFKLFHNNANPLRLECLEQQIESQVDQARG